MDGFEILVEINAAKRSEFLQAFEMVKTENSLQDARIYLALFEQVNTANTFLWIEHWQDGESMKQYRQSNAYRMMLGAVNVLGKTLYNRMSSFGEGTYNGQ